MGRIASLTVMAWLLASGVSFAQACLHETGETPEQLARRRAALTATRTINNIEANQPDARQGKYLRHADLSAAPWTERMKNATDQILRSINLAPGEDILPRCLRAGRRRQERGAQSGDCEYSGCHRSPRRDSRIVLSTTRDFEECDQ